MRNAVKRVLSTSNMALILALFSLTALYTYESTASARYISSANEKLLVQDDDASLVPPVNPDGSQDSEPRYLDDPAFSPGAMTSEPDSGAVQEEPGTDGDDDTLNGPDAEVEDASPAVNGGEPVLNEPQPGVEEPLPLVNQAQPLPNNSKP